MANNFQDSFQARLDLLSQHTVAGIVLTDENRIGLLGHLLSSPIADGGKVGAQVPRAGAGDGNALTTMESNTSKLIRETLGLIRSWLVDVENPQFTTLSANFYTKPERLTSWVKARLETILRDMGTQKGQEGDLMKSLCDRAAANPGPVPEIQGDGLAAQMMRGLFRKFMLRLLAVFTVACAENINVEAGNKPMTIQKRVEEEGKIMTRVMNPTVEDRVESECARIVYERIQLSEKQTDVLGKNLGGGNGTQTGGGGGGGTTHRPGGGSTPSGGSGGSRAANPQQEKEKRTRPPGWAAMDEKGKKACVKVEGWCIACIDMDPPRWFKGLASEHDKHPK